MNKFFSISILNIAIYSIIISCSHEKEPITNLNMSYDDSLAKSVSFLKEECNLKITSTQVDIDSLICFLDKISNYKALYPAISKTNQAKYLDSITETFKRNDTLVYIDDSLYISSEYLVNNAILSLKGLHKSKWSKSVSFDDFCNYILPYKVKNEFADYWRDSLYLLHQILLKTHPELCNLDSLYQYHLRNTYISLNHVESLKGYYPSVPNYTWLNFCQEGDCESKCRYTIYHLRAAGAPATFDYIPNWGNYPKARHSFVGLANKNQQLTKKLENINLKDSLIDNLNTVLLTRYSQKFDNVVLPFDLYIQYVRTIPKVFRETWVIQPKIRELITNSSDEELYYNLVRPNMVDVTSQYMETSDVEVSRGLFDRHKLAYLATFDINGWIPVAYAEFNWFGKSIFKDMGRNILYMPVVCNKNKVIPFGDPFILDNYGKIQILKCNSNDRINMRLIRKFPLFSYTAAHAIDFKSCIIEGSNDDDYKNSKVIHTINTIPLSVQKISFSKIDTFQYIRIVAPEGVKFRLAEFECYKDSLGNLKKITDIKYKEEEAAKWSERALDGDYNTYTSGPGFTIEFCKPEPISQIRICPRSDSNFIIPGNEYELFYWDGEWISAGKKNVSDFEIQYNNIPSKTMYWLRCISNGKEERIFTYEDGKQIWW